MHIHARNVNPPRLFFGHGDAKGKRVSSTARAAANKLAELLDTPFLRALAEPARLEVLKILLVQGSGDVASIADKLPQDRSVVSRHLRTLEEAGIVRSTWQGRHRIYEIDGRTLVDRFDSLSTEVRSLCAICCPPARRRR